MQYIREEEKQTHMKSGIETHEPSPVLYWFQISVKVSITSGYPSGLQFPQSSKPVGIRSKLMATFATLAA